MIWINKHVLTLLIYISVALTLKGCAHTEKYLHPEKTFSEEIYDPSVDKKALQITGGNNIRRKMRITFL